MSILFTKISDSATIMQDYAKRIWLFKFANNRMNIRNGI